ncbi:hypothetical protein NDU88_002727 [Pleurodeles waltl]|uniref:Uncharacterized protein n=1 Tax=Pleurodeles waltl TaxID=8319 RepID=A0AAV7W2Y8_PLEWA|nr:hypothetical protein NDU88_002727 [Pleurodeles waltl]
MPAGKQAKPKTRQHPTAGCDHHQAAAWPQDAGNPVNCDDEVCKKEKTKKQPSALTSRVGSLKARKRTPHTCTVSTVAKGRKTGKMLPASSARLWAAQLAGRRKHPEMHQQPPKEGPGTGTCRPENAATKKEPNTAGGLQTAPGSHMGPPTFKQGPAQRSSRVQQWRRPSKPSRMEGAHQETTVTQAQQQ